VSYDLHVYAKRRLDLGGLTKLLEGAGLDIEPGSQASGSLTIVRGTKKLYCFTLGDAVAVEAEDVPEEITAVVLGPSWMYELLVEGSSSAGTDHAIRFGRRLAEETQGAVLDRQTGQTWSKGRLRAVPTVERGRTDIVECRWYTLRGDEPADLARSWLTQARQTLPEALPRRFGSVEPLAGRLDRDGDAGFVSAVAAEPMTIYFSASAPCIGGHLAGQRGAWEVRGHALRIHREPLGQVAWHAALRRFFAEFARSSRAFYASAEVVRNIVWSGRGIGYDGSTERTTYLAPRGRWYGLTPYPVWWSWFGNVYAPLVAPHLPAPAVVEDEGGILYEAAPTPASRDELSRVGWLPPELLARLDKTDPRLFNPPLSPATHLPIELAGPG
jgi:hypothetical protein